MVKIIENLNLTNQERGIVVTAQDQVMIRNCTINGTRIGIDVTACPIVDIQNCDIGGQGTWGGAQYAYLLRSGFSGIPSSNNGVVRISACNFHDIGTPSGDYSHFNRDILDSEGGELWVKDSTLSGASDGCVDTKTAFKLKNCKVGNSHRLMRIWPGNTQIISGCQFTSAVGHSIAWFQDKTSKLIVYNCTFDGQPTIPLAKIEGDSMTPAEAAALVQYVTTEPLTDPWFLPTPSTDEQILLHVKALAALLK